MILSLTLNEFRPTCQRPQSLHQPLAEVNTDVNQNVPTLFIHMPRQNGWLFKAEVSDRWNSMKSSISLKMPH